MEITNELLKAYATNNVSQEERLAVRQYLTENPEQLESVLIMMDDDADITLDEPKGLSIYQCNTATGSNGGFTERLDALIEELGIETDTEGIDVLPMTVMAAENKMNNLCVIHCEGEALRHFGFDVNDNELIEESMSNGWLQDGGTALHNIGRLSGTRGLSVAHRYNCSFADIGKELDKGKVVIAVVNSAELNEDLYFEHYEDGTAGYFPDHAVIVTGLTPNEISIQDSSTPQKTDTYPLEHFFDAWADSSNYLIIISNEDEYEPHPIDLSDIEVSEDLIELREAIAENAHEVWAANRKKEGWTYGAVRDDEKKQHPDMVAYNRLPESEKLYDREMAMNTIKLVKKLGYNIVKRK